MNTTAVYRRAIKRTFAGLYGVSPDSVDVTWTSAKTVVVQRAGKTFIHLILSDRDDDAPLSADEDPVIVNLTDEERHQLERAI